MTRWQRRVGPPALALGAFLGSVTALGMEATSRGGKSTGAFAGSASTPVLSVRRLPEVLAEPVAGRRLRVELRDVALTLPPASCLVVHGPDLRFEHRGDVPVVPASTQKLLTATAALELLGGETRLRTTAMSDALLEGGVLRGDLVLVGGGDPLLSSPDYAARFKRPRPFTNLAVLAAGIRDAGIRAVEGSVVGDGSRYDGVHYVDGWPSRYISQNAVGPLSGLAVNDGFASYPTRPGGPGSLEAADDPPANAAAVLTRLLSDQGVQVTGPPRSGAAPPDAREIAAVSSPPLVELVEELLVESDNETGELLLKELGRSNGDPSTAGGAAVVEAVLAGAGVDANGVEVVDGSGLALENRVTCNLLVDLLARPVTGPEISRRLAIAGEAGTLAEIYADGPLAGVLRAKTGTLNTVTALAGLVDDADPALLFALVVNVAAPERVPPTAQAAQQRLVEALASWPRTPDERALGPRREPLVLGSPFRG